MEPTLKRGLSLSLLTLYGLGTILGAGIYVLIGEVVAVSGRFAPVAFITASLLAVFTAFSYAELASRFPHSAGEAVYVEQGLRWRPAAVTIGLMVIGVGMVSAATIANGFVGYLHQFVVLPDWLSIVALVLLLTGIAAWGITESALAAALVTLLEISGLVLIIVVAGDGLTELPQRLPELLPPLDGHAWQGILLGAFLAFYAYIGFEDMVNVAEETRDPSRTLPRAILLAIFGATALYVLVALVAVLSPHRDAIAGNRAPLAMLYSASTGSSATLISLISLLAVTNGALIQIIMAARVVYGMARRNWLPPALARVHPVTRTPLRATLLIGATVLALALWLPLVTLAQLTSLITLLIFALVNASVWIIKGRGPAAPGVRTYPRWLSAVGFSISVAFLLVQIPIR